MDTQSEYFTPIGSFLTHLYQKIAWEEEALRDLSDYFRLANFGGHGAGQIRTWPTSIYSDQVRARVEKGDLRNDDSWDEWSLAFS